MKTSIPSLASSARGDKTSCLAAIFVLSKRRGETLKGKLEGEKIARNFAFRSMNCNGELIV